MAFPPQPWLSWGLWWIQWGGRGGGEERKKKLIKLHCNLVKVVFNSSIYGIGIELYESNYSWKSNSEYWSYGWSIFFCVCMGSRCNFLRSGRNYCISTCCLLVFSVIWPVFPITGRSSESFKELLANFLDFSSGALSQNPLGLKSRNLFFFFNCSRWFCLGSSLSICIPKHACVEFFT